MTQETPQERMNSRLNSLHWKIETLQSSVRLSNVRDSLEDLQTLVKGLRSCIQDIRQHGYVFGKGMEDKADNLAAQWQPIRESVDREMQRQGPRLELDLRPLENEVSAVQGRAANPAAIESTVTHLESELESFESRVNAVVNSLNGMFDAFSSQANEFKAELDRLEWMLQQYAEASFQLLPTEGAVMAVKARYSRDAKVGNDDPDGILYLTDQRLFYEQKQEVATKKILFITTEKEKVQKLLLEVPVALVGQVKASKKGLFSNEDHLEMAFKPGAAVVNAWFHLNGQDCNWWLGLIGQARSAEFAQDRVVPIDPQEVQKVKSAPGKCPSCGAPVNQVVLRGMDSITCEYCQFVIRLD